MVIHIQSHHKHILNHQQIHRIRITKENQVLTVQATASLVQQASLVITHQSLAILHLNQVIVQEAGVVIVVVQVVVQGHLQGVQVAVLVVTEGNKC